MALIKTSFQVVLLLERKSDISEIVSNANKESDSDTVSADDTNTDYDDTDDTDDTDIIPDYYGDEKYDTAGNASLIKEQRIIYDSSEMQFIAVTTKSGHVFYILIDYAAVKAAENGEAGASAQDTVYFLNKVDDYDLYSLLYEDGGSVPNYDTTYSYTESSYITSEPESGTEVTENENSGGNHTFLIFFAVAAAAVVGGYYFLKIRPKKKEPIEIEDDALDFDYDDDEEISEDASVTEIEE